jgi:hypothetical protein
VANFNQALRVTDRTVRQLIRDNRLQGSIKRAKRLWIPRVAIKTWWEATTIPREDTRSIIAAGIEEVFESCHDARAVAAMMAALDRSDGDVWLQGISLGEFFHSHRTCAKRLTRKALTRSPMNLRALLLDPQSRAARARAVLEQGVEYGDEPGFRTSTVFTNMRLSVAGILNLLDVQANSGLMSDEQKFRLNLTFIEEVYSFVLLTSDACFFQPNHFGIVRYHTDERDISSSTPVFQFRSDTHFHQLMLSSLINIWNDDNRHISHSTLDQIKQYVFR